MQVLESESLLLMLPGSKLSYCFSFLSSTDLLELRLVDQWLMNFITGTCTGSNDSHCGEADVLWRQALMRDFKFRLDSSNDDDNPLQVDLLRSLKIREITDQDTSSDDEDDSPASSIFGYPACESVFIAKSSFESWKHWAKASAIFCNGEDMHSKTNNYINGPCKYFELVYEYSYVNACMKETNKSKVFRRKEIEDSLSLFSMPDFLRAANLWSKVEQWCNNSKQSGNLGARIKASLRPGVNRPSGRFAGVHDHPHFRLSRGATAVHMYEAVFSFYDGQDVFENKKIDDVEVAFFGGYCVHNHLTCTFLYPTDLSERFIFGDHVPIAGNILSETYNKIVFNVQSGELLYASHNQVSGTVDLNPAYKIQNNSNDTPHDAGLLWLEEYVRRLHDCELSVRQLKHLKDTCTCALSSDRLRILSPFPGHPSPLASRRVTRGVEVIASSLPNVDLPAIVYSMRIRLLQANEDGYLSPTERGFDTCQLLSRHWTIKNEETGEIVEENGEGVEGCYPLLREGGYRDDQPTSRDGRIVSEGIDELGTFVFQSSLNLISGYFAGRMQFLPGSIIDSSDQPFHVDVGRFPLDPDPDIRF